MGSHALGVTHYGRVTEIACPVDRVVIVGAGIAGLAAASRLTAAGIDYVVLEARDRIGGRLHTIDLAGTPVDLGGSWIHHPVGNPMSALCDELDVARDPGDPMPSLSGYDRPRADAWTTTRSPGTARWKPTPFGTRLKCLASGLGRTRLRTTRSRRTSPNGSSQVRMLGGRARTLRAEVEADAPGPVGDQSLLGWPWTRSSRETCSAIYRAAATHR